MTSSDAGTKLTDEELRRLETLQLTYDGWGIAIHDWAPDAIKRAVAELRRLRSPEPASAGMVEKARAAIDKAAKTENAETIIQFFADEFTLIRSQAIEDAARVCDREENDCAGLCAASIRAMK